MVAAEFTRKPIVVRSVASVESETWTAKLCCVARRRRAIPTSPQPAAKTRAFLRPRDGAEVAHGVHVNVLRAGEGRQERQPQVHGDYVACDGDDRTRAVQNTLAVLLRSGAGSDRARGRYARIGGEG